jgi:hypothetical protein
MPDSHFSFLLLPPKNVLNAVGVCRPAIDCGILQPPAALASGDGRAVQWQERAGRARRSQGAAQWFPIRPAWVVTRPDPAEHCSLQQNGRPRWVATRALPHGGPQRGRQRGQGCSRVWSLRRRKQRASAGGPQIRLQSEASGHRVSSFLSSDGGQSPSTYSRASSVGLNPAISPRLTRAASPQCRNAAGVPRISPAPGRSAPSAET